MATKKDLVEAYSFSRRRLVTAFLSGAPGGREVEPARPGRTVVGGLALAILVVAAAAIASVLAARTPEDWDKVGLVVSKQTAAQYVILKQAKHPTLIPVINITSAQLILGADLTPTLVDQSVIEGQTPGQPIGILGAPQLLPEPSQFIEQGWTSCTDDSLGMSLDISRKEQTTAQPGRGAVVYTTDTDTGRKTFYLIARSSSHDAGDRRAYAYPMPNAGRLDQALRDIGLDDQADAVGVPQAWVRLFPSGGALTAASFPIPDFGAPPPADVARFLPAGTTIGQFYKSGDTGYVITDQGSVILDPFALAVYQQTVWGKGKQRGSPTEMSGPADQRLRGATQIFTDAHWPDSRLTPVNGQLCAQLNVHSGQEPGVALRSDPSSSAAAPESSTPGGRPDFVIDRGQGSYVMVGDWDDTTSSSRVVVDPRGTVYTLNGDDTITKLGYNVVSPPLLPDTWIKLLTPGVSLSTNGALCPPYIPAGATGAASTSTDATASPSAGPSASASAGTAPGSTPDCEEPPS